MKGFQLKCRFPRERGEWTSTASYVGLLLAWVRTHSESQEEGSIRWSLVLVLHVCDVATLEACIVFVYVHFCVFAYVWEGICICVLLNTWYVYATSHVENMWTHTLLSGYICSAQPAFFKYQNVLECVSRCTYIHLPSVYWVPEICWTLL